MDSIKQKKTRPGAQEFALCSRVEAHPPASVLRDEPLHRSFKAVEQAFRRAVLHLMRAQGIDDLFPGTTPLILHLGDEDGLTLSELGKRCGLESSTVTPLVDELERHHIAQRARAPEDRRVVRVYLTDYGRELEPRLRALILHMQEIALTGLSAEEMAAMRHTMECMVANLETIVMTDTYAAPDPPE